VKPNEIYSAIDEEKPSANGDVDILGPRVLANQVVRLDTFYVINLDRANLDYRLGIERYGTTIWFKRARAGSNTYGIAQDTPTILVGGERPVARVESAQKGDSCWLVARGPSL